MRHLCPSSPLRAGPTSQAATGPLRAAEQRVPQAGGQATHTLREPRDVHPPLIPCHSGRAQRARILSPSLVCTRTPNAAVSHAVCPLRGPDSPPPGPSAPTLGSWRAKPGEGACPGRAGRPRWRRRGSRGGAGSGEVGGRGLRAGGWAGNKTLLHNSLSFFLTHSNFLHCVWELK